MIKSLFSILSEVEPSVAKPHLSETDVHTNYDGRAKHAKFVRIY